MQRGNLPAQAIYIFFEINEAYGSEVCEMLRQMGYTNVQLKNDLYGKPRMVFGTIAR
jgi:release factor glutamine methyltransferase